MTIRDQWYWQDLLEQLAVMLPYATDRGMGVRVTWNNDKPLVTATPTIPAGLVEEVYPAE